MRNQSNPQSQLYVTEDMDLDVLYVGDEQRIFQAEQTISQQAHALDGGLNGDNMLLQAGNQGLLGPGGGLTVIFPININLPPQIVINNIITICIIKPGNCGPGQTPSVGTPDEPFPDGFFDGLEVCKLLPCPEGGVIGEIGRPFEQVHANDVTVNNKLVIPVVAADPVSPVSGQVWINSTERAFKFAVDVP